MMEKMVTYFVVHTKSLSTELFMGYELQNHNFCKYKRKRYVLQAYIKNTVVP